MIPSEARRLTTIFRAAAKGATAATRPPDDWTGHTWTSEVFSAEDRQYMRMMENVFTAIADVYEKTVEAVEGE